MPRDPPKAAREAKRLEAIDAKEEERKARALRSADAARAEVELSKPNSTASASTTKKEARAAKKAEKTRLETERRSTLEASVLVEPIATAARSSAATADPPLPPPPPANSLAARVAALEGRWGVGRVGVAGNYIARIEALEIVVLGACSAGTMPERAAALEEHSPAPVVHAVVTANHSTNVPGLRKYLDRLKKCPGIIKVNPGPLREGHSNAQDFDLRLQREGDKVHGSYKLVARKGHTAQDVFVICNPELITEESLEILIDSVLSNDNDRRDSGGSLHNSTTPLNKRGLESQQAISREVNEQANASHHSRKQKEVESKQVANVRKELRKLKARVGPRDNIDYLAHAARNSALINGDMDRGKRAALGRSKKTQDARPGADET
jgi:hypothetical protein